ncbi:hypothetical protein [Halobacillus sp. A5]|uniref:hypothetical protein n=1 Tax=Halobacillus sp. A5 TaxID=2880263 RepID=UPI0020A65729|nr:hypothetical protein [Halobacillus sp. A5]MCP3026596.1 hypothetical protein [Halobacillus sp. A5]
MDGQIDARKVIDIQTQRHAQKVAGLEQEVAILMAERDQLVKENKQLKENQSVDK